LFRHPALDFCKRDAALTFFFVQRLPLFSENGDAADAATPPLNFILFYFAFQRPEMTAVTASNSCSLRV
jgi:hypothetical protein